MDSMMGIFYEESSRLVEELKRNFSEYIGKDDILVRNSYRKFSVQSIQ